MSVLRSYMLKACVLSLATVATVSYGEDKVSGQAAWDTGKTATVSDVNAVAPNMSRLIFVRFEDNLSTDTSLNIGVNNRFLVSLSPNHWTESVVCAGVQNIGLQSTANKSNDLMATSQQVVATAGTTQYYRVGYQNNGAFLMPLDPNTLADNIPLDNYLATMQMQNHQISRVTASNCPKVVSVPTSTMSNHTVATNTQPNVRTDDRQIVEFHEPIEMKVLFDTGSVQVKPSYYARIAEASRFINQYNATVIIEGHTDNVGDMIANRQLSIARAKSVRDLMVEQHSVNPDNVSFTGFGEDKPVDSNLTESGRQQNRRVVVIILK